MCLTLRELAVTAFDLGPTGSTRFARERRRAVVRLTILLQKALLALARGFRFFAFETSAPFEFTSTACCLWRECKTAPT